MTRATTQDGIRLHWIPLGAGSRVVPRCGRAYERLVALRAGRVPQPLFHAALEVTRDEVTSVIEMAPAWADGDADRGVVREGPVGLRWLGRLRWFRYEVRCWPHGRIPDLAWAVGAPTILSTDPEAALVVAELVRTVPELTWGRDELGLGEMWNSNGLVAWLLSRAGADVSGLVPPDGGRAPGWGAGIALADLQHAHQWVRP